MTQRPLLSPNVYHSRVPTASWRTPYMSWYSNTLEPLFSSNFSIFSGNDSRSCPLIRLLVPRWSAKWSYRRDLPTRFAEHPSLESEGHQRWPTTPLFRECITIHLKAKTMHFTLQNHQCKSQTSGKLKTLYIPHLQMYLVFNCRCHRSLSAHTVVVKRFCSFLGEFPWTFR